MDDDVTGITEADLLRALEEALVSGDAPEGALTALELADAMGLHINRVRGALRALKKANRLEVVRISYRDLADRLTTVPAYRIKK